MAYTAAAMYGGAVLVNLVEGAIPGGPESCSRRPTRRCTRQGAPGATALVG
jgi:hypothetical protein